MDEIVQQFGIARTAEDLSQLGNTQLHQLRQVLNAIHHHVHVLTVDAWHLHQHVLHVTSTRRLTAPPPELL